jgi:hypothetical protein
MGVVWRFCVSAEPANRPFVAVVGPGRPLKRSDPVVAAKAAMASAKAALASAATQAAARASNPSLGPKLPASTQPKEDMPTVDGGSKSATALAKRQSQTRGPSTQSKRIASRFISVRVRTEAASLGARGAERPWPGISYPRPVESACGLMERLPWLNGSYHPRSAPQ